MALKYTCDVCGEQLAPGDAFVVMTVSSGLLVGSRRVDDEHVHKTCMEGESEPGGLMDRALVYVLEGRSVDFFTKRMGQNGRYLGT